MEKKSKGKNLYFWRFAGFLLILFGVFVWLVSGLISLQLNQNDVLEERAESKRTKTIALRGKRGSISTADSVIMAEDELIYNITFQKDASSNSKAQYQRYTNSIIEAIDIIERNGGTLAVSYVIERDPETGEWRFNFGSGVSEATLDIRETQWRTNNYATSERKYGTAELCIESFKERYQIPENIDENRMLQIMAIYSEMQMNIFNSQPIIVAKDVRYETVIEIETRSMMLPGFAVEIGTKRVYPRSTLASQIIGYTGAIPSRSMWLSLEAKGYSYNDTIGRDGIESSMEDWLTQNSSLRKGSRVVERDQMSRVVRELDYTPPQDGNNVKLTLNASYQQMAERCIADNVNSTRDLQEKLYHQESWLEANKTDIHTRDWGKYPLELAEHGCLIVLDMQCRVLAMANYPTYDLNALVAGGKDAVAILSDSRNLLLNYGIHARGTPGSIFKMVTGMGALATGELKPNEKISDGGYYTKYNADKSTAPKCWINKNYIWKHYNQTIIEGLTNSCNYFFYTLSDRLGEERLYRYASLFGLTSRTGIDLPGEVRSVVGSQNTLYDPSKPVNEANQDTSLPIIVFNSIKRHLRNCGTSRNIEYSDERLSVCAKRLMDMAVNYNESEWLEHMRTILMEEVNMTKEMVYLQSVIGDTYNYMNDIKWGGGQTILTGIGQSVTVLTPIAVARYVCTVANNGYLYNVSLIDSITSPNGEILSQRDPTLIHRLDYSDEFLPLIREGMKGVVDESGTAGKYFKNWPWEKQIAAKTGTAQVTSIDLENNAWFVCFAPYDNPEIAVACFIPNGYSGSEAAKAPRDFIGWYMEQKTLRSVDIILPAGNSLAP